MKGNVFAAWLDLHNERHRRVRSCWIFFCMLEKMSFEYKENEKINKGEASLLRGYVVIGNQRDRSKQVPHLEYSQVVRVPTAHVNARYGSQSRF